MTTSNRKRHGVVYTPESIVALILDNVLPTDPRALAAASICDPACGEGAFLVAVVRRVLASLDREEALAVLRRLSGYDIDGAAVATCKVRLDEALSASYPDARVDWDIRQRDAFDRAAFRGDYGRFTHVVGNPPYIRVQHLEASRRKQLAGQWAVLRGATDSYLVFYELGLDLLASGGVLAYITPSSWLRSESGSVLRRILVTSHSVRTVLDFSAHQVFDDVTTYTAITVVQKGGRSDSIPVEKYDGRVFREAGRVETNPSDPSAPWTASSPAARVRMEELARRGPRLQDVAEIHVGVQTLADDVFILPVASDMSHRSTAHSSYVTCKAGGETIDIEGWMLRHIVKASVMKNGHDPIERVIIFPYDESGALLPEAQIREDAPLAYDWLSFNKSRLLSRDKWRTHGRRWYAFGRHVSITSGFGDKILTSGMNLKPRFQYCPDPAATFYSGYCIKPFPNVDSQKLLSALNSHDMEFFISQTSRPYQGNWMSYAKAFIKDFPVPRSVLHGM